MKKRLTYINQIFVLIISLAFMYSCTPQGKKQTVIGGEYGEQYSLTIPAFLIKSSPHDMSPDASMMYQHALKGFYVTVIVEEKDEVNKALLSSGYKMNLDGALALQKDYGRSIYNNIENIRDTVVNGMQAKLCTSSGIEEGVPYYAEIGFYESANKCYQVVVLTEDSKKGMYLPVMREILYTLKDINMDNFNNNSTIYYSADSLFSVSIPTDYTLADTVSDIGLYLKHKNDEGDIFILKDWNMSPKDFEEYVIESINGESYSAFKCDLITQTDSFVHYKISKGTFSYNNYYMRKDVMRNDYIIHASGVSLDKQTALYILSSVKEYDLKEYQNKSHVKDGFTYYNELGFAIDRNYKLEQNNFHIKTGSQVFEDKNPMLGSYLHTRDEDDPNECSVYNITVMKRSNDLKDYALSLKQESIDYEITKWNNIDAVEYSYLSPMGNDVYVPTKAIYFIYNQKSYMFQVISFTDVAKKHKELLNSIIII